NGGGDQDSERDDDTPEPQSEEAEGEHTPCQVVNMKDQVAEARRGTPEPDDEARYQDQELVLDGQFADHTQTVMEHMLRTAKQSEGPDDFISWRQRAADERGMSVYKEEDVLREIEEQERRDGIVYGDSSDDSETTEKRFKQKMSARIATHAHHTGFPSEMCAGERAPTINRRLGWEEEEAAELEAKLQPPVVLAGEPDVPPSTAGTPFVTKDLGDDVALSRAMADMKLEKGRAEEDELNEGADIPPVPGDRVVYQDPEGQERTGVLKSVNLEMGISVVRRLGDTATDDAPTASVRKLRLGFLTATAPTDSTKRHSWEVNYEEITTAGDCGDVALFQGTTDDNPLGDFGSFGGEANEIEEPELQCVGRQTVFDHSYYLD
ncbi:hypothetical protein T484DRAFT_1938396, partial [Baffinella frigidus]